MESLVDSTAAAADQLLDEEFSTTTSADTYYTQNCGEKDLRLAGNSQAAKTMLRDSGFSQLKESKVPDVLRFPLVVILSLVGSSLAYSLSAAYLDGEDMGRVSRRLEGWDEVGALFGWRTAELALGWFGDYDGYDLAALSLLSRGPSVGFLFCFVGLLGCESAYFLRVDMLILWM